MLPQGGITVLSEDHPGYLSFLFFVQNDRLCFFWLIAKVFTIYASICWIFYIWKSTFNHFKVILSCIWINNNKQKLLYKPELLLHLWFNDLIVLVILIYQAICLRDNNVFSAKSQDGCQLLLQLQKLFRWWDHLLRMRKHVIEKFQTDQSQRRACSHAAVSKQDFSVVGNVERYSRWATIYFFYILHSRRRSFSFRRSLNRIKIAMEEGETRSIDSRKG